MFPVGRNPTGSMTIQGIEDASEIIGKSGSLLKISENISFFYVEIIDINGSKLDFKWIVEKVKIKGEFYNCWMTTSVSALIKYGESI